MTRHGRRTVLVVVPSTTAGTWLSDTLSLLAGDRRIATFCTVAPSEKGMTCRGAAELLRAAACPVLPWRHAVRYDFDLVLTADSQGLLGELCYDRLLASIPFRAGYRHVFGLSRGQKLVLAACPSGSTVDSVVGLLARLLRALPPERYRVGALVSPDAWWGPGGRQARTWFTDLVHSGLLLPRPDEGWRGALVAANLLTGDTGMHLRYGAAIGVPVLLASSADSWQQDGVVRPWRDGAGEMGLGGVDRRWRDEGEAGLDDVDRTWRDGLGEARLDGADGLVRRHAPRLRPDRSLLSQVEAAMRADRSWQDGVAEQINPRPGYAGDLLRRRIYELLDLVEPARVAPCHPVPLPRLSSDESACDRHSIEWTSR